MPDNFTAETLPKIRYLLRIARYKVPGGWYVRAIFTDKSRHGEKPLNEAAIYISDPDHIWLLEGFLWEKLEANPLGGVYRAKVHNGWIILATMRGAAWTDDDDKYNPRLGSLVYFPDVGHSWKCSAIPESDPKFYGGTA